jgi:uncharacterized protein YndB with AHSA1/START domain
MIEIKRERTFQAPVDTLWRLIEPVERLPEWFANVDAAEVLGGQGVGRRQRVYGHWNRSRLEVDQTVFDYQPNSVLAWYNDAERLDGKPAPRMSERTESHVRLTANGAATRVELISRLKPSNALKGAVLRVAAVSHISRVMENSLARIEQLLATGSL